MKIDKTLDKCGELAGMLLKDYKSEITEAIQETDDEDKERVRLSVSFVIEPQSSTEFEITASLSFTKKRYSDKISAIVNELQRDLFEEKDDATSQ